jgi:hypothetical protein
MVPIVVLQQRVPPDIAKGYVDKEELPLDAFEVHPHFFQHPRRSSIVHSTRAINTI